VVHRSARARVAKLLALDTILAEVVNAVYAVATVDQHRAHRSVDERRHRPVATHLPWASTLEPHPDAVGVEVRLELGAVTSHARLRQDLIELIHGLPPFHDRPGVPGSPSRSLAPPCRIGSPTSGCLPGS